MTISLKLEIIGPLSTISQPPQGKIQSAGPPGINKPEEQLASCGPQLQSTCGTIGIMRTTTSINLRNN